MKKQIILLVLLLVILGLLYVIFGDKFNKRKKIENIEPQDSIIINGFTSKDLYYGCYWGDINQKKIGTPTDWVLVYPGTQSAQWCNSKKAKSILAPASDQQGAKIRAEMSQVGCPDEMIVNKMPSVIDDSGVIPPPKAYYIKDGKRVEVADYDAIWVNANCEVPVTEVQ